MSRDLLGRPLRNLRISVTDRCNLRCSYCMPEPEYVWLPRSDVLTFEEIERVVLGSVQVGVRKVRLTGGEPLLRRELPGLVARIAAIDGVEDLAMTTNAVLLADCARELRAAGLRRLNVSLDTLRADRFEKLTRGDELRRVLAGIDAARRAGFDRIKLNVVVMREVNDDELADMIAFGSDAGAEVRFIEYMDVGGATRWDARTVVPRAEILARLGDRFGAVAALPRAGSAPAESFRLADGTRFGVIASTTSPFCSDCDRGRLTADGRFFFCLYATEGVDLRALLRDGATPARLAERIAASWRGRSDRGAEERLEQAGRSAFLAREYLVRNPHSEMHTRGG